MYVLRTRVGDREVVTPYMMTPEEYGKILTRRDMYGYFRSRNAEIFENRDNEKFNLFDMNFALGPLEKVFGPGGVRLTTQGSVQALNGDKEQQDRQSGIVVEVKKKDIPQL